MLPVRSMDQFAEWQKAVCQYIMADAKDLFTARAYVGEVPGPIVRYRVLKHDGREFIQELKILSLAKARLVAHLRNTRNRTRYDTLNPFRACR